MMMRCTNDDDDNDVDNSKDSDNYSDDRNGDCHCDSDNNGDDDKDVNEDDGDKNNDNRDDETKNKRRILQSVSIYSLYFKGGEGEGCEDCSDQGAAREAVPGVLQHCHPAQVHILWAPDPCH